MSKTLKILIPIVCAVLLIIVLAGSLVVTQANEYTIIRQFGAVVRIIDQPGLSLKTPFVQSASTLPKTEMLYDLAVSDVITSDKKSMVADSFVLWRIDDPLKFIQTLSGSAQSFGVYLLGAFIAGFSMCLLNTVVNPMLNKLGGGGNKGNQLIQAGGSFNSLCGTAVIILTGLLIPEGIKNAQISNVFPLMYAALAIFAFAFIVISLTKIPETNKEAGVKTAEASKYGPLSFRHFMLGAIAIFVYVGIEVGIPNVLQKWLQNPDLNVLGSGVNAEAVAGSVAATYWFLMLIGRLLGAAIGSKVSAKSMLTVVSSVGLLLTLGAMFAPEVAVNLPVFNGSAGFGLVNVPVNAALLVLIGLCTSVMWGGIFNLAVEGLGKYTEKASGIFMALVCGGGILPLLQNAIVDVTDGGMGYLTSYWVIVIALAYLLYYALVGSKNVNKDIPVTE